MSDSNVFNVFVCITDNLSHEVARLTASSVEAARRIVTGFENEEHPSNVYVDIETGNDVETWWIVNGNSVQITLI